MKQKKQRYVTPTTCIIPIAYENQAVGFLLGSEIKAKAKVKVYRYQNEEGTGVNSCIEITNSDLEDVDPNDL